MGSNYELIENKVRLTLRELVADTYEWSTEELERHVNRALQEVSEASPYEHKVAFKTVAGSKEIALSTYADNLLFVIKGEYPVDNDPPSFRNVDQFGNDVALVLSKSKSAMAADEDVNLYLASLHELTKTSSTMNKTEEDALIIGAAVFAAQAWMNLARTEVKTALTLYTTIETSITAMTARIEQAVTDIADGRAKVGTMGIGSPEKDLPNIASREMQAAGAYLNQSFGYIRELTQRLKEPSVLGSYQGAVNIQLAEFQDRLRRITKNREYREYSRD